MTTDSPVEGDDPMPVFVIKAKDNLAISIITAYAGACNVRQLFEQSREVLRALDEVEAWRSRNPDLCKDPDHKHVSVAAPSNRGGA